MSSAASNSSIPFELEALSLAEKYQGWVFQTVSPYIGERVLELGAGIGNMSKWLPVRERLILTESDPALMDILLKSVQNGAPDSRVTAQKLALPGDGIAMFEAENLDCVISFNVLEHIENDRACLESLIQLMRKSKAKGPKRLVTFVPAHSWAYGSMDKTFGHYRRYSTRSIRKLAQEIAPDAKLTVRHFNFVGLIGWFLNGRILRKPSIGVSSIKIFETICPIIAPIDNFFLGKLGFPIGQSMLFVLEWN